MQQFQKLDYDKYPIYINCENETELMTRLNSCKREPDTVNWVESFEKTGFVMNRKKQV